MTLTALDVDAWLAGNVKLPFTMHPGEPVRVVIEGKAVLGKVSRPLTKTGNPEYLVELETNEDVVFKQSEMQSLQED